MNHYLQIFILILQIIGLYFFSRLTINEIFYFFRIFIKDEKTIAILVALLFFPGTIFHEMAHYFFALIMMLNVREIKLIPEFDNHQLKLGKVLYEKKDFVRGIIVGLAPIIFALVFFWWLAKFSLFPNKNLFLNIFFIYIIFVVSSTMFSSRQDLIDLIYIIPLFIILIGLIYIFDIKIQLIFQNQGLIEKIINSVSKINFFLLLALLINLFLIIFLRTFRKIIKK
ncbi:MAG: hypothetical protein QHH09_04595 [Microgenomates group bacterium]|nr:hypothetical protein [Microgenomates group bacterium]